MRNSALADWYVPAHPSNYACGRNGNKISKITIHHMAGHATAEQCGSNFSRQRSAAEGVASANYGVGYDGSIALYVDEANRTFASSSTANDNVAVTIEVSNDGGAPDWHVSDAALGALVKLCADICVRNDITRLNYTGDTSGNLTRHNMFAATTCPGPYLQSKFPYIAEKVNEILEDENVKRYNTFAEIADWAKPTIQKLIKSNAIAGSGAPLDGQGYPTDMNLSDDMIRIFVVNDRQGLYK